MNILNAVAAKLNAFIAERDSKAAAKAALPTTLIQDARKIIYEDTKKTVVDAATAVVNISPASIFRGGKYLVAKAGSLVTNTLSAAAVKVIEKQLTAEAVKATTQTTAAATIAS